MLGVQNEKREDQTKLVESYSARLANASNVAQAASLFRDLVDAYGVGKVSSRDLEELLVG